MPDEKVLDVESGAEGFVSLSCGGSVNFYCEWCNLPCERQDFFQLILAAQERLICSLAEEVQELGDQHQSSSVIAG